MQLVTARSPRAIREAVAVTARTVPPAVVVLAALAVLPVLVTRLRGGHDFTLALQAAALFAGSGAGFAADDQAANLLASSPTPLVARRALRAMGVCVVLATSAGLALVLAVTAGGPPVALAGPLAVLAAAAGTAGALASVDPTDVALAPGVSSALGTVLALVTLSSLAERWSWAQPGPARVRPSLAGRGRRRPAGGPRPLDGSGPPPTVGPPVTAGDAAGWSLSASSSTSSTRGTPGTQQATSFGRPRSLLADRPQPRPFHEDRASFRRPPALCITGAPNRRSQRRQEARRTAHRG